MKILSILFILSILIIPIITSSLQPKIHKHFLLAPAGFKLSDTSSVPDDLQSISMFKIGDVSPEVKNENLAIAAREAPLVIEEAKIIPSSFIQTVPAGSKVETQSPRQNLEPDTPTPPPQQADQTEVLQQIEKMLNNELDNNSAKESKSPPQNPPKVEDNRLTCPACDILTNKKYRDELIAWNTWRSNIQNKIMEDSHVDADYGTIFFFFFKVDKNRNVSNIRVICTRKSDSSDINAIRHAINSLKGNSILEFPKGTNRTTVDFQGGFLMGDYSQYSTPGDFNDYERIRTSY